MWEYFLSTLSFQNTILCSFHRFLLFAVVCYWRTMCVNTQKNGNSGRLVTRTTAYDFMRWHWNVRCSNNKCVRLASRLGFIFLWAIKCDRVTIDSSTFTVVVSRKYKFSFSMQMKIKGTKSPKENRWKKYINKSYDVVDATSKYTDNAMQWFLTAIKRERESTKGKPGW